MIANLLASTAEASKSTTPGVPEVVSMLFPNLPNFIAHVLATIIIILVLWKLVYKPFRTSINNRREKINELLNSAIEKQAEANADRKEAELILNEARSESKAIVKSARVDAEAQKSQILDDAYKQASNMQLNAKSSIEREKVKAKDEMKDAIVEVAFQAAEKVLQSEISKEKDKKIVDQFIEELDKK